MTATLPPWLAEVPAEQPHSPAFVTVSGAHLYGFPSVDSDVDLRGAHILPLEEVVGLRTGQETITRSWERNGVEVDLVTHDLAKFCGLLLRRNGYVLEQLLSPLVVATSPIHQEMIAAAPGCLTRHHANHYLGFARSQWRLFERSGELKPLLYTFRVLLTGIHLMRTGTLVADLGRLTALTAGAPPYLPDLMAAKRSAEHAPPPTGLSDPVRLAHDVARLTAELEEAKGASRLPDAPASADVLHDLVVRTRLAVRVAPS
ncbi:DNA polymerase beta superfamily protein [Streptosporangium sp. NPDC000396]|uniref:nucleotidyltransferase domain-containing protein n=1 Tax=Streptosporangium sp. NPDC000396 TaxID=3366185 RepID=UPI0036751AAD